MHAETHLETGSSSERVWDQRRMGRDSDPRILGWLRRRCLRRRQQRPCLSLCDSVAALREVRQRIRRGIPSEEDIAAVAAVAGTGIDRGTAAPVGSRAFAAAVFADRLFLLCCRCAVAAVGSGANNGYCLAVFLRSSLAHTRGTRSHGNCSKTSWPISRVGVKGGKRKRRVTREETY